VGEEVLVRGGESLLNGRRGIIQDFLNCGIDDE